MSLEGRQLGQYQLIQKIGAGGMATVYLAFQPNLEREVAVKVLDHQTASPGLRERFLREAKAVAQLNHPNILPIYDVGQDDELTYFVMKYVPGQTLAHHLQKPPSLKTLGHYIDQIARALDHAHDQNILHRDIKPSNILLDNEWLLLADFGLAKVLNDDHSLTNPGTVMGTPHYISPEQAEGKTIDSRSDIYSLGVVLYEMATGQLPYQADTPMALMFKHVYEALPPPRKYNPSLSKEIEHIIVKALSKDPNNRYQRAGELSLALQKQIAAGSDNKRRTLTIRPNRFFVSYQVDAQPDQALAAHLYDMLSQAGHQVFIDRGLRSGDERLTEIERHIRQSDFLIVLLSKESAHNEMLHAELKRADEHRKQRGRPIFLPIRLNYDGPLPYSIDTLLDHLQPLVWKHNQDNPRLIAEILAISEGRLTPEARRPASTLTPPKSKAPADSSSLYPPQPEFDPRLIDTLEAPGGVVKLHDKFYIERQADDSLRREIIRIGTTTSIRASRQMGKSSLLVRGLQHAKERGFKIVNLDLQRIDDDRLASPDLFLRDLAEFIVRKLRLDSQEVERAWAGPLGPQDKLTYLMEDYILPETDTSIILALDEVDRLLLTGFHSSFFALLRSWHNSRAFDEQWEKLNMVLVISTEPYLLISDVNQSPFNVGLKLVLDDFTVEQVEDLNRRHGSPVTSTHFSQLLALLNGHPYLTRRALYAMVTDRLDWPELCRVAATDQGPFGDHLRRHWWLLRDEPQLQTALRQVIQTNTCVDPIALFRLLQSGLIKGSGDYFTCRCDLYRSYFKDKLT